MLEKTPERNVDSYISHMKVKLEAFKSFWKAGMEESPANFPETMSEADWAEQLASFANW